MSLWNQSLKTDGRLWAVATAVAFVLLTYLFLMPIKGERTFYWDLWTKSYFHRDPSDRATMLGFLTIAGCVLAVAALTIGWVLQAVVVMVRAWFTKDVSRDLSPQPK